MKHRKMAAVTGLVCAAVLFGGCLKENETAAVTEQGKQAEETETEVLLPEETKNEMEKPFKETEFVSGWGGDGTLTGFYRWMKDNYPNAKVAVARVGTQRDYTGGCPFWESVESQGYFPFIPEEMDGSSWTELENGENRGNIWAVIPLNPSSSVTVAWGDGLYGEKPEEARISLFYLSDREEENGVQVDVKSDETGETTTFLLNDSLNNLPMAGSVVDVTLRDGETAVAPWRLHGWWTAEDGEVQHRIWFGPDGHFAWFEKRNGKTAFCREGTFATEEGQLSIKMADENMARKVPVELKNGILRMNTALFPFPFLKHSYFEPKTAGTPYCYATAQLASAFGKTVLGEEEAENCRIEIVDSLQNGWLVRCCSPEHGNGNSSGWWVINPDGPCYDFLTGETLSLKGLTQKTEKGFVKAVLVDGKEVFVTFSDSPLLKAYLPGVKTGKKYPVNGLSDRLLSVQLEYARLDNTPFLFIREGNGGTAVCDLMKMTETGSFVACPLKTEETVIDIDTGELPGGEAGPVPSVFACLESGTLIDALTGKTVDFSANASQESFSEETFMEEIQPVLHCLQSCDWELFGAEVDNSTVYSAGMADNNGRLQPEILYQKGTSLPRGYKQDPGYTDYYPVKNFKTNEEIRKCLSYYMTEEMLEQLFHDDFLEYEGQLYLCRGGRGYGSTVCQPETAEYLREEKGQHMIKVDYWSFGEYDYTVQMVLTDTKEGWKIDSVIMPETVEG